MVFAVAGDIKPRLAAEAQSSPPVVLATTKPLHSIAAYVTDGVSDARLLLEGGLSPHVLQLKPSHIRAVSGADVVIWAGDGVERFVPSMLEKFAPDAINLEFAVLPSVITYPSRGVDRDFRASAKSEDDDHNHEHHEIDYHVWLQPANAKLLALALAEQLAAIDVVNAKTYRANADALVTELDSTVKAVKQILANASGRQYLIYHDSLQYFEKAFDLGEAIIVTSQPQVQAGARRIRKLQAQVDQSKVSCILAEQQFRSPALAVLADDLNLRSMKIDPLASEFASGPALYTQWLTKTAETIAACVQ